MDDSRAQGQPNGRAGAWVVRPNLKRDLANSSTSSQLRRPLSLAKSSEVTVLRTRSVTMLKSILFSVAVVGVPALSAQSTNVVFPTGRDIAEGSSNNNFPLSRASMRYQQVEYQAKGKTFVLRSMEFRKDGSLSSATPARTITATIRIGNTNGATFGNNFANNWLGTPTVMANGQTFNLPALTKPTAPPAQFLVKFPFSNITAHTGQTELLWEMVVTSNSSGSYACDAHRTGRAEGSIRAIGVGCPSGTSRFNLTHAFRATQANTELYYSMSRAPANAPGIVLIGAVNPNLQLPGACTRLYTTPVVDLLHGTANSSGTIAGKWYSIGAWNPFWSGAKLYSQGFAPDATKPTGFTLTQGRELTLPPVGPGATAQTRLYSTSATATTGSMTVDFGLVVRFP